MNLSESPFVINWSPHLWSFSLSREQWKMWRRKTQEDAENIVHISICECVSAKKIRKNYGWYNHDVDEGAGYIEVSG